jgi:hypothetical protein
VKLGREIAIVIPQERAFMVKKSTTPQYRIIPQKDLTYGVGVDVGTDTDTDAGMSTTITGLSTEIEARDWIVAHENSQMLEKMQRLGILTKRKGIANLDKVEGRAI